MNVEIHFLEIKTVKKLVIAKIGHDDLKTVFSVVEPELRAYPESNVGHMEGKYCVIGRKHIQRFVDSMKANIAECRKHFTDDQSVAAFNQDEEFLNSLLKIKAS
jgi:hypothetical protein